MAIIASIDIQDIPDTMKWDRPTRTHVKLLYSSPLVEDRTILVTAIAMAKQQGKTHPIMRTPTAMTANQENHKSESGVNQEEKSAWDRFDLCMRHIEMSCERAKNDGCELDVFILALAFTFEIMLRKRSETDPTIRQDIAILVRKMLDGQDQR
jgi:hypothetical protein